MIIKSRRVEGGGMESSVIVVFIIELWIEGLVLPFFLNSDNGGTIEVAGE